MNKRFGNSWMVGIFLFLYLPIAVLIVYSFNKSSIATKWGEFSFAAYNDLINDGAIISALWLSLKIAFSSATVSAILGTFAAFSLVRYPVFKGRTMFNGMTNAPLVMPDVIIGISILMMLVAMQQALGVPEKGMFTILLGHSLLGVSYATVVIEGRLREMDASLEEAAMDLGCKPHEVFRLITLPLIVPSILSGWLLTFSLSFDDVVLASFLSGPGSNTLPMVIIAKARLGVNPVINATATATIVVVSIGILLAAYFQSRAQRRRLRDMSAAYRADGIAQKA
jgi:putrescine transport system permease protein